MALTSSHVGSFAAVGFPSWWWEGTWSEAAAVLSVAEVGRWDNVLRMVTAILGGNRPEPSSWGNGLRSDHTCWPSSSIRPADTGTWSLRP